MAPKPAAPNLAQLDALPETYRTRVPAEYGDVNGHMNVRHHLALHDDGGWRYFAELGFGEEFIERERRSFFDLEHHVRYYAEVMVGDEVAVRIRLLDRGPKLAHAMSFLINLTRGEVASSLEVVNAFINLDTRRTTELTSPTSDRLDTQLAQDRALPWAAPLSGAMGV